MFDSIVLTTGGPELYQKAMIDLDPTALSSQGMHTAFQRLAILRNYVDPNFPGRDWNLATSMVIKGDALMQVMGDWAKGEFVNAGKVPGKDFLCERFPGTQGTVTFNTDQFVFFKLGGGALNAVQTEMASDVGSAQFQSAFNVIKGAAPAQTNVPDTAFDSCGKKAIADIKEAVAKGTLLGSSAQGYGVRPAIEDAMYDVITREFNGQLTADQAFEHFPKAISDAQ
jgi:glucose/mannose transport system substrate-binding protein